MFSTESDAVVVNGQLLKCAKRRVTADMCDFLTLSTVGDGIRNNLKCILHQCSLQ